MSHHLFGEHLRAHPQAGVGIWALKQLTVNLEKDKPPVVLPSLLALCFPAVR